MKITVDNVKLRRLIAEYVEAAEKHQRAFCIAELFDFAAQRQAQAEADKKQADAYWAIHKYCKFPD